MRIICWLCKNWYNNEYKGEMDNCGGFNDW